MTDSKIVWQILVPLMVTVIGGYIVFHLTSPSSPSSVPVTPVTIGKEPLPDISDLVQPQRHIEKEPLPDFSDLGRPQYDQSQCSVQHGTKYCCGWSGSLSNRSWQCEYIYQ